MPESIGVREVLLCHYRTIGFGKDNGSVLLTKALHNPSRNWDYPGQMSSSCRQHKVHIECVRAE